MPKKFIVIIAFVVLLFGCKDKNNVPTEPSWQDIVNDWWGNYPELGEAPVIYEVSPFDTSEIFDIFPLGHIFHHKTGQPSHPIPTDHTYWTLKSGYTPAKLKAPASGIITVINNSSGNDYTDYSMTITHTNTFKTVFWHLTTIDSSIIKKVGTLNIGSNKVSIAINAGDILGTCNGIDMGSYYKNANLSFIHPEKYPLPIPFAVSPLEYFQEPFKTSLYEKVKRVAPPRGGKIDFDILGKLSGNWFYEGTTGKDQDGYKNYLAFVYDVLDPKYLRISLGIKALPPWGLLARVKNNGPDFKNVDINSGQVVYKLMEVGEGMEFYCELYDIPIPEFQTEYTLLVKVIDNEKIKIQVFDGDVSEPTFTENAKYFTR